MASARTLLMCHELNHWGIGIVARLENIFDANYAFASVNPGNAPAFGPFVGRNVFGGLSLRCVFS